MGLLAKLFSIIIGPKVPAMVTCPTHGRQVLDHFEFARQKRADDSWWHCPKCGQSSPWTEP